MYDHISIHLCVPPPPIDLNRTRNTPRLQSRVPMLRVCCFHSNIFCLRGGFREFCTPKSGPMNGLQQCAPDEVFIIYLHVASRSITTKSFLTTCPAIHARGFGPLQSIHRLRQQLQSNDLPGACALVCIMNYKKRISSPGFIFPARAKSREKRHEKPDLPQFGGE